MALRRHGALGLGLAAVFGGVTPLVQQHRGLCVDRAGGKSSLKWNVLYCRGTGPNMLFPVFRVTVIPVLWCLGRGWTLIFTFLSPARRAAVCP